MADLVFPGIDTTRAERWYSQIGHPGPSRAARGLGAEGGGGLAELFRPSLEPQISAKFT